MSDINWDEQPLGEEADTVLAERLNVPKYSVRYQRIKRGISPRREARGCPVTNWDEQPLGDIPDTVIAEKLGVHPSAVTRQRNKRNIAPFGRIGETMKGKIFGRLKVLRVYTKKIDRRKRWVCVCQCPKKTVKIIRGDYLRSGHTKSCGCLKKDNCGRTRLIFKEEKDYISSIDYIEDNLDKTSQGLET